MAKKTTEEIEAAKANKRKRNRASAIRVKMRKDESTVTDEERAFLAEYEAEPHGNRIVPDDSQASEDSPDETPEETPAPSGDAPPPGDPPAPTPAPTPPPPSPRAGKLAPMAAMAPPPPPKDRPVASASKGERWTAKYQHGNIGDTQAAMREHTCVFTAGVVHKIMMGMTADLKAIGVEPMIDVDTDEFRGTLVIAADHILPPHVLLTPELYAAGAGGSLLAQRWWHRKAIKEHQDREALKKRAAGPVVQAMPAAPPPPPPPPVTPYVPPTLPPPPTPPAAPPPPAPPPPPPTPKATTTDPKEGVW